MTAEKLLTRVRGSCETTTNTSVVCTDKTGTVTQNVVSVVSGSTGIHAKFVRNLEENKPCTNAPDQEREQRPQEKDIAEVVDKPQTNQKQADEFSTEQGDTNTILSSRLEHLLNQSITTNSTAFEDTDPETKQLAFVGSKTETALLQFAKDLCWEIWKQTRGSAEIVQMIPFSSERKVTGVVVRLHAGSHRLFLKGASEILTKKCTHHVSVSKNAGRSQRADSEIETKAIDEITRDNISRTIIFYANQMLRTIALCYRDFRSWPPAESDSQSDDEAPLNEHPSRDLNPAAIAGIKDPLCLGVREAVTARLSIQPSPILLPSESLPPPSPQETRRPSQSSSRATTSLRSSRPLCRAGVSATPFASSSNSKSRQSTNITAAIINFVSAVASSEASVLFAAQLLWIDIIMDTFTAPRSRYRLRIDLSIGQETGYPMNEAFHH